MKKLLFILGFIATFFICEYTFGQQALMYENPGTGDRMILAVGTIDTTCNASDSILTALVANDLQNGEPSFYELSGFCSITCNTILVEVSTLQNKPADYYIKSKYIYQIDNTWIINPNYGVTP